MADYYPLLSRALDALPDRSPALRKAVYDRARSALIGQLRSLEPPIPDADIDLERDALDAAIARLEAGYGVPPKATQKPETAASVTPAPMPAPPPVRAPPPADTLPPALPEPGPPPFPAANAATEMPAFLRAEPPARATPSSATADGSETESPEPPPVSFVSPVRKPKVSEPGPAPAEIEPALVEDAEAGPEADASGIDPGNGRQRPKIDVVAPHAGRSRLLRNAVVGGLLLLVIGAIAVAAFMLRDQPADISETAENGQETPAETPETKFADRVVGGGEPEPEPAAAPPSPSPSQNTSAQPAQQEVMSAQRAILYEENASDPKAQPTSSAGRVTWRLEPVNGEQGEPLQNAVRANVEFPDAGLTLAMTIKKNLDSTLPASHTVELAFTNFGKGEKRGVQDIGLLQLKDEANARGSPVSGLPVRVRDNLFLIGLSNLPTDIERNTDLLLRQNWLDLALKYRSGQRAVLAFDKGNAGNQVMQGAFDQWRN